MAQLPNWTDDVSDLVMDAQVIAMRAVDADGERTADEQKLLDALYATQERIMVVHGEINAVTSTLRSGRMPRRLRARYDDTPDAA
jgi:hypothetical protein